MRKVEKGLEFISILFLMFLVAIILVQVIARYLHFSLPWTEELARYTLVALSILGGAFAYYKGEELKFTLLIDKFPPKLRIINDIIVQLISLGILIVIIYSGIRFVQKFWGMPSIALEMNQGILFLVIPLGFSLILFKFFSNFRKLISQFK